MKDGKKTKSILKGASFFLATFAFVGMLAMGTRFVKHKDYNNAGSQIVAVAAVGDTASIEYKYKVGDGAYNVVDKFVGEAETVHTFGQTTNLVDGKVAGYYFRGWYDNADCTGDALTTLDSSLEGNQGDTITLYAKLEVATTRTLTAQTVEHGTYHLSSTTGRYGEAITLVADTADENYEITGGYYTDADGNNRVDFEKTTFECPDFDALVYATFGLAAHSISFEVGDGKDYGCSYYLSKNSAVPGEEITITVELAEGYGLKYLGYMSGGALVPITQHGENENEYVFTMPSYGVDGLIAFGETFDVNWTQFKVNHASEIVNNVTTFISATNMQNEEGDTYIDTNVYARISGDTLYLFSTNSNKVVLPSNCNAFFVDPISNTLFENLESIYLDNLDTSRVENISNMFNGCESVKTLDLSGFDLSNVTSAEDVFAGCTYLQTIKTPNALPSDTNVAITLPTTYSLKNNNFATTGTLLIDFPVSTAGTKQVIYRTDMLHNVTVDSTIQNGTVTVDYAKYVENETVTINATPASGYDVEAYYYYQVGSPENKMSVENATFSMPNYDIVVGAEFTVPSAIIYKNEGGADFVGNFDGNYPTTHTNLAKELKVPTRAGYHFAGWYLDQACTENSLASQEWDSELGVNVTKYYLPANQVGDTTVYAKWAPTLNMTLWEAFKEDYATALANVERVTTLVNQEVQTGDSQLGENIYARIYDNAGTQTLVLYSTTDKIYLYDDSKQFFANAFSNVVSMDLTKFDTTYVTDISEMFNGCSALTSLDLSSFVLNDGVVVSDIFTGCNTLQTIYTPQRYPLLTGDDHIDLPGYWTSDGYGGYINYMEYFTNSTIENRQEISRVVLLEVNVDPNQGFGTINWAEGSVLNMVAKNAAVTVDGTNVLVNGVVVATAEPNERYGYDVDFNSWSGLNTIGTDSVSLTASFTSTAHTHTVTFDTNGGTLNEESQQVVFGENYGVLPTPTREGYVFDGWIYDSGENYIETFTKPNTSDTAVYETDFKLVIADNQEYPLDQDITIKATWTKENWLSDNKWEMFKIGAAEYIADSVTKIKTATNMTAYEEYGDYALGGGNYARIDGDTLWIFSTSASKIILPEDASYFFYMFVKDFREEPQYTAGYRNIFENVEEMDLSNFDTSNVKSMRAMFATFFRWVVDDEAQVKLTELDLSNFNTANVTDMSGMFAQQTALTNLNISNFNTSNVTNMGSMFLQCESLTSLNLSHFDTSNVTDMSQMFKADKALTTLTFGNNFDTSNVTDMNRMFAKCNNLTALDVTGFDTSNVTCMSLMFAGCNALTSLDLSSFDLTHIYDGISEVEENESYDLDERLFEIYYNCKTSFTELFTALSPEGDRISCDNLEEIVMPKALTESQARITLPGVFKVKNDEESPQGTSMWEFADYLSTQDNKVTLEKTDVSSFSYILYELDGGTANNPTYYTTSTPTFTLNAPVKEGYTFLGWIYPGQGEPVAEVTITQGSTGDKQYMAIYAINEYTLTFVVDGENYQVITQNYGTTITPPADPAKEGYTFTGWSEAVPETMPAENKTITANFEINEYTLTFVVDGENYQVITQNYGTEVIAPADPTKEGYTFTGWSEAVPETMPAENKTITANFEINQYTITFVLGNGEENVVVEQDYGTTVTPPADPTKEGYTFGGWDREVPATIPAENITINATWTAYTTLDKTLWEDYKETYANDILNVRTITTATNMVAQEGDVSIGNGVYARISGETLTIFSINDSKIILPEDCSQFFYKYYNGFIFSNVTTMDLSSFDTTNVTNMGSMFSFCSALTSLDVSGFNTSNVTNMEGMFYSCSALTSLDVSGFDTSNVTSMSQMFCLCQALTSITFGSNFNTTNVTDMGSMFDYCCALTSLDVSGFDTANVTNMGSMFFGCQALTSLDVSGFNTTNVTSMAGMFHGCHNLTTLDLSSFNTEKVTSMASMFSGLNGMMKLEKIELGENFKTTNVTDMRGMFNRCASITSQEMNKIIAHFDTSNVTNMGEGTYSGMFYYCEALTSLDLSGFDTSNVTSMAGMFYGCSNLTTLDLSSFNTSNVTTMGGDWSSGMFSGCSKLESINFGANFNTSKVTNMGNMFAYCSSLTSLDLSGFDTSNVTNMSSMFAYCYALTSITFGSNFNTTNVTNMGNMFSFCSALTSLELSNFDMSGVTSVGGMLNSCNNLTTIYTPKALPSDTTLTIDLPGVTYNTTATYGLVNNNYQTTSANLMDFPVSVIDTENPENTVKQQIVRQKTATASVNNNSYGTVTTNFVYYAGQTITEDANTLKVGDTVIATATPATIEGYTVEFDSWDLTALASNNTVTANFTRTADEYTITLNGLEEGDVYDPVAATYTIESGDITLPTNVTRERYTFLGWTGEGIEEPTKNVTILAGSTGNKTYTANFELSEFNVYGASTTNGSLVLSASQVVVGDEVVVTLSPDAHYEVDEVYYATATIEKQAISQINGEYKFTMPAEDVTVYATFKQRYYTITQDQMANGHLEFDKSSSLYGETVTVTIVPDAGYELKSGAAVWYYTTDPEQPTPIDYDGLTGSFTMPGDNVVVCAEFEAIEYTLTLKQVDTNGAVMAVITQKYNTEIDYRSIDMYTEKTGYTFTNTWSESLPTTMPLNGGEIYGIYEINQYTITFVLGNGEENVVVEQDYGTAYNMPMDPERTGYTFGGWDREVPATIPAENITINATWTANEYTLTIKENDTYGAVIATITQGYGTTIDYSGVNTTKYGYTFGGYSDQPQTMPLDGGEIYAYFTANGHTLYFNANGGYVDLQSTEVTYGQEYGALPIPTRDGYTFLGWYDTNGFLKADDEVYNLDGDTTFTAYWQTITYKIILIINNEVASQIPYTIKSSDYTLADAQEPTGYSFLGWTGDGNTTPRKGVIVRSGSMGDKVFTAKFEANRYDIEYRDYGTPGGFSGTTDGLPTFHIYDQATTLVESTRTGYKFVGWMLNGEMVTRIAENTVAENITLDAVWEANSYDIVYRDKNNVTFSGLFAGEYPEKYTYDRNTTLVSPTRVGYDFVGWFSDAACTQPITQIPAGYDTQAVTVYADWTAQQYTITYCERNGAEFGGTTTGLPTTHTYDQTTVLGTTTKEGYTFAGWYTDEDCQNQVNQIGAFTKTENFYLYAKFDANKYDIVYKDQNGADYTGATEGLPTQFVYDEQTYLPTPTRAGYDFVGWFLDQECEYQQITEIPSKYASQAVTVYAKWNEATFTVYFNTNGGYMPSGNGSMNATYLSAYGDIETPEKEYYDFAGWYSDAALTNSVNADTIYNFTQDSNLYAKWTPTVYTITLHIFNNDQTVEFTVESDSFTLAHPQVEGYTFVEWLRDGNSVGADYNPTYNEAENYELTANFEAIEYTYKLQVNIELTDDQGNPVFDPEVYNVEHAYTIEDDDIALPNIDVSQYGVFFRGWTGEGLENPTTDVVIAKGSIGNRVYVAHFTGEPFTMTFDALGGEVSVESMEVRYQEEIGTLPQATKDGYTFAGWYRDQACTDGNEITADMLLTTKGDFTAYAKWKANAYKIRRNIDGVTFVTLYSPDDKAFNLPIPTKRGYKFVGWTGTDLEEMQRVVTIASGSIGDKEYVAHFELATYIIALQVNGETYDEIEYTMESRDIKIGEIEVDGYTFNGWTGEGITTPTKEIVVEMGSVGNKLYKANLTAHTYTATITIDGEEREIEFTPNSEDIVIQNPTKDGYVFLGWQAEGSTELVKNLVIKKGTVGDQAYTAVWEEAKPQEEKAGMNKTLVIGIAAGASGLVLATGVTLGVLKLKKRRR